jgi:hypothetical protein
MELAALVLLGVAIGAAAMWLLERWRSQRNPSFYRFGDRRPGTGRLARFRNVASMVRSPIQPSPEELARMLRMVELLTALDDSPLLRVLGVGEAVTVGEVTVELLAIELRAAGCRGTLRYRSTAAFPDEIGSRGRLPVPRGLPRPEVLISDDAGTAYEVAPGNGGGTARGAEYQFVFTPRPSDAAHRLTVSVTRFGQNLLSPFPMPEPVPDVPGPWDFSIPL